MPVGAALSDEMRTPARLGGNEVAFRRREAERLVEVDVDVAAKRHHRRQDVLVVRRLDDDRVDLAVHLLEHVLVGREAPRRREVRARLGIARVGDVLLEEGEPRRVRVDDRDEILAEDAVVMARVWRPQPISATRIFAPCAI